MALEQTIFGPLDLDTPSSAGALETIQPQISDPGNSIVIDENTTVPWTGDWYETRSVGIVRQLTTLFSAVTSGLGGTFTFEYSEDGATATISEERTITSFSSIRDFDLLNAGAYYRVKFDPDRALTGGESIIITTTHRTQNDGAFVRLADQQIEKQNAAMPQTFAYIKGFDLNGNSVDASVTDVVFQKTSAVDGALPTGGAPTIDPVLNADANVLDSGWIPTLRFPGGNFFNIAGDQTLNVYLLNASDDSGSNMVGDTAPSIQTTAFVPATLAAPYFDAYYRVVISNESGSSLTDYSIYNRAHSGVQQSLTLGLEQTLLSFFSAQLDRSVVAAKNDAGNYGNITRADGGALRIAMNEHEEDTPIRPCDSWSITRGSVAGTAAAIPSTPLARRTTIAIQNVSNNRTLIIGTSAAQIAAGQYWTLGPGAQLELELGPGVDVYARSDTTSPCDYELIEVGDGSW